MKPKTFEIRIYSDEVSMKALLFIYGKFQANNICCKWQRNRVTGTYRLIVIASNCTKTEAVACRKILVNILKFMDWADSHQP